MSQPRVGARSKSRMGGGPYNRRHGRLPAPREPLPRARADSGTAREAPPRRRVPPGAAGRGRGDRRPVPDGPGVHPSRSTSARRSLAAVSRRAPRAPVRPARSLVGAVSTGSGIGVTGGAAAPAAATARRGDPLLPMLADIAADVDEALAAHRGRSALEFKYDGALIQLHREGDGVAVWTRRLSDVTRSLPDVVAIARRDLGHAPFILDGEVLALDPAGRPLPFQELMRRFRRVHGVDALVREMPLALYFFDCLMVDGGSV